MCTPTWRPILDFRFTRGYADQRNPGRNGGGNGHSGERGRERERVCVCVRGREGEGWREREKPHQPLPTHLRTIRSYIIVIYIIVRAYMRVCVCELILGALVKSDVPPRIFSAGSTTEY